MINEEFPFVGSAPDEAAETLETFREYAWDFDNDTFIYDSFGNMKIVEGNEALKIWIVKALRTERFNYLAYSPRYGSEHFKLIGKAISIGERRSELRRAFIECLNINPYIKSVDEINFTEKSSGREVEVTITLTTLYGSLTI